MFRLQRRQPHRIILSLFNLSVLAQRGKNVEITSEDWSTVPSVASFVRPSEDLRFQKKTFPPTTFHVSRQWHLLHTDFIIKSPVHIENESTPRRAIPLLLFFWFRRRWRARRTLTCLVNEFRRWILTRRERERKGGWHDWFFDFPRFPRLFGQF